MQGTHVEKYIQWVSMLSLTILVIFICSCGLQNFHVTAMITTQIQGLSRAFYIKFQNSQGPTLFSRTWSWKNE